MVHWKKINVGTQVGNHKFSLKARSGLQESEAFNCPPERRLVKFIEAGPTHSTPISESILEGLGLFWL